MQVFMDQLVILKGLNCFLVSYFPFLKLTLKTACILLLNICENILELFNSAVFSDECILLTKR